MSLRVKDLSGATQSAVRTTRRLGGFVAGADYSTDTNAGVSLLTLRVPVGNLQKAIASSTPLGRSSPSTSRLPTSRTRRRPPRPGCGAARRSRPSKTHARLAACGGAPARCAEEPTRRSRSSLTTTEPAAKHVVPSRFDRFRDNAGDILGKELIAVLYALVIAGPFILLAALALIGERARRRRADHRLLEETG